MARRSRAIPPHTAAPTLPAEGIHRGSGVTVFTFAPFAKSDLELVRDWLRAPHVAQWWGDPEEEFAELESHFEDETIEPFLVAADGKPIGYLQSYDPHRIADHPFGDQPAGTRGLDLFIGEADHVGRGLGSELLQAFADRAFAAGLRRLVADPDPRNARALRAYLKAGFHPIGERDTPWGLVTLLARDLCSGGGQEGLTMRNCR
jgi:aminoglycoside 6'-N-acetyltransferase